MDALGRSGDHGPSFWLAGVARPLTEHGDLREWVTTRGIRGAVHDLTVLQGRLRDRAEYDPQVRRCIADQKSVAETLECLEIEDIQAACDDLRPVYDTADASDGFACLDLSPDLAYDASELVVAARRLWSAVGRPNLMLQAPATSDGMAAGSQLLSEGVNIAFVSVCSTADYQGVAAAYLRALEQRISEGKSLREAASIASFRPGAVDELVDELLGQRLGVSNVADKRELSSLLGRSGVAVARLVLDGYRQLMEGPEWRSLADRGARPQRLRWDDLTARNPLQSELFYVEALLEPQTVVALPEELAKHFLQQSAPPLRSEEADLRGSRGVLDDLRRAAIDLDLALRQLQYRSLRRQLQDFRNTLTVLSETRLKTLGKRINRQTTPAHVPEVDQLLLSMERSRFAHRLLRKDPTLWKSEPDTAKLIRNRLGWLDCVREFRNRADEILKFASQVRHDGIRHTVLLGMGGSALCPEVCAQTFGSARGWPELLVLDNTDPAAVRYIESQIDLEKTLFVVPSKSGATLETLCFYRHFYELVGRRSQRPGHAFAAITDAGTWLAREAAAKRFRACFVNPPDIGGRYSALSFFGLTPMALLGLDIRMLLERALQFQISCGAGVPTELNPGIQLGTLLAHYYRHGRDKLTLVMAKNLSAFGYWVEQLVAESTGKEGLGIVPVVDEGLGPPTVYNDDRVFVYVSHGAAREPRIERRLVALEKAGHPTVRIQLPDRLGLGEEFFRWELAVATAGAILGVNPFDEPDLLETRGNTLAVLNQWKRERSFPEEKPAAVTRELAVYAAEDIRKRRSAVTVFHQCLDTAQPGDYVAFLAYFRRGPARDKILQTLRRRLRDRCHVATTLAYGPRYLHSTGQLYKEGPDKGIFILLTADVHDDIPVPGQDFSFGVLQRAQALADLASLREKGRRVIHVHLQRDLKDALKKLLDCLSLAT